MAPGTVVGRRMDRKGVAPGGHSESSMVGGIASGIYFVKIQARQGEEVQRVTVLK